MEEREKVTYADKMYDEETVQRISKLRQERWAILHLYDANAHSPGTVLTEAQYRNYDIRLKSITQELYELTGNPIYRAR